MYMEAKIRGVWCLNLFKIREVFGMELLFHKPIRQVKIKMLSKSVGPVVLMPSNPIGQNQIKKSEDYVFLDTLPYGGGGGGVRKEMEKPLM